MKINFTVLPFFLLTTGTLLFLPLGTFGQTTNNLQLPTSINTNGSPPDSSAILDIQSTDKGLLMPRMTTAQRDAIANPEPGLIIYNTTDSCFNYFVGGSTWVKDCGRSLTADSNMPFVKQGGGTSLDEGNGVATDASGNVFVTGTFYSTAIFGSDTLTSSGDNGMFIVKYDRSGKVLWAKKGSGTSDVYSSGVATDASDNAIVTGTFYGTATFGSVNLSSTGGFDMFIVKYDESGNVLWARKGGGTSHDAGNSVSTDATGNVIATGSFSNSAVFDSEILSGTGGTDVFTVKYDESGNVVWQKGGGTSQDEGFGVTTDASGNVIVTGWFKNTATFGSDTLTSTGDLDVFTVKYNASGNVLWAKQSNGIQLTRGNSVATDVSGNVFITGHFYSMATFDTDTLTSAGVSDVFIVKYDPSGNVLWRQKGGGSGNDVGFGVATDLSGHAFVTGKFFYGATFGSEILGSSGISDVFTVKYDALGNVIWAKKGGGTSFDEGYGLATDQMGNVFITGMFQGTSSFGNDTLISAGSTDMFLIGYSASGEQSIPTTNLSASQDNDADPTNELQNWGNLPGIPAGFSDGTDDVDDADADPANELNTSATLNGNSLEITDAGGTIAVDLSSLNPAETDPEVGTNTTNYLPKWDGSALVKSTSVFEDTGGKVGIGTMTPAASLDVRGINGEDNALNVASDAGDLRFRVRNDGRSGFNNTYTNVTLNVTGIAGDLFAFHVEDDAGTSRFMVSDDGHAGVNQLYSNVGLNIRGISSDDYAFNVQDHTGSHRFTVKNDGKTGIGTLNPNVPLQVNALTAGDNIPVIKVRKENCGDPCGQPEPTQGLHLQNINATAGNTIGIGFADLDQDLNPSAWMGAKLVDKTNHRANLDFRTKGSDSLQTRMVIDTSGKVGIGRTPVTNLLEVEGEASKSSAGNWLANSDARLKTHIRPLDSEEILQKMLALQGIAYEWADDKTGTRRPAGTQYGFTAQNIQQVFPELVSEDNLGYLQTAYGTYDAMTVEAIRALKNENDALKAKVERMQVQLREMEEIKHRMARLEAALFTQDTGSAPTQASED